MKKPREELDAMLAQLEAALPKMIQSYPDGDIMEAFAGEAEVIEDSAGSEDIDHVRGRINCMLGSSGLIPSDNEGEPCD